MTENYKVTQKFMDELMVLTEVRRIDATSHAVSNTFRYQDFRAFGNNITEWHLEPSDPIERNNRLIAIIQWLNGEDVFEVEEPHKFIVRSDKNDDDGDYAYVLVESGMPFTSCVLGFATKFDTREEAQEWASSHQVVVEID
ncbi:hypothetical protein EFL81_09990 [Weissella confusa]|uniref:hypothetical protein n=1 Tax=Weissella confusa TaxID=1583 RepID=UPI00223B3215|nr:hypothetical protein [Weissella confusa]MCS9997141.1 hypothetical protein [Weissella confusa]